MKTYDAFLFYNEIEVLEMRLRILNPYVDYFVISECDYTFSGKEKCFNFEENFGKFSKYVDKIIYVKNYNSDVTDPSVLLQLESDVGRRDVLRYIGKNFDADRDKWGGASHWSRDYLHREFVRFGLKDCHPDDLIIFGDIDEIPSDNSIAAAKTSVTEQVFCCKQDMYYYSLNLKVDGPWLGTRIAHWRNMRGKSLNSLRSDFSDQVIIENGGWHFSFFGGEEKIRAKIQDYSHQEFNTSRVHSRLRRRVLHGRDIYGRNMKIRWVPLSHRHPSEVFQNREDFAHFQSNKPRVSGIFYIGYSVWDFLRRLRRVFHRGKNLR